LDPGFADAGETQANSMRVPPGSRTIKCTLGPLPDRSGANSITVSGHAATRACKAKRYPADSPIVPDASIGSYLAVYWVLDGHNRVARARYVIDLASRRANMKARVWLQDCYALFAQRYEHVLKIECGNHRLACR
jgi:hypothetical protein